MDILNQLSTKRFRQLDDLLAFISIYDDQVRTRAFSSLLRRHASMIRGSVCVEGGAGLGLFSVEMARLGAQHVYAVEQNPLLASLARARFQKLPRNIANRIELIESPLQRFVPPKHVNILVHEFYGQLLYDEDLWVLDHLRFRPDLVLPDGGELRAGVVHSALYRDSVVTSDVLDYLEGSLVSGLFEENLSELKIPVLRWQFHKGLQRVDHSFADKRGDLLCLGLVVTHRGKNVCQAGRCPNWSYAWTPRGGNKIVVTFKRSAAGADCRFKWVR